MANDLQLLSISQEQLENHSGQGLLVLTVNNRLARTLTERLALSLDVHVKPLIAIKPWSEWLGDQVVERLFISESTGVSQVLDTQSSRLIWAHVIQKCEQDQSLIDVVQMASMASQADALLLNWQIEVPEALATADYQRFQLWRSEYEKRLYELNAIDAPRLARVVADWIAKGEIEPAREIVLFGFSEFAPAMKNVIEALRRVSVKVYELESPAAQQKSDVFKVPCTGNEDQWRMAAQWAAQRLQANPAGKYAIVVPSLQSQANLARRVLQKELHQKDPEPTFTFNVSVAPPLAEWPLAQAMLAWLELVVRLNERGQVEPARAGRALLLGGCAGSQTEAGQRALIDAKWRQKQRLIVTRSNWQEEIAGLVLLSQAWRAVEEFWVNISGQTRSWFEWSNVFRQTLLKLGFPGDEAQDSIQYQTSVAIDRLLSQFSALDDLFEETQAEQAYIMLAGLARQTLFQPQRDRSARLDVLGLLEAEGGSWDGVWIMGVTDDVLPAAVSPNPLIPVQALVNAGAPRATAQREYDWAKQLMEALSQSGHEVIFSWPELEGEQPKRPSPFLQTIAPLITQSAQQSSPRLVLDTVVWDDEPDLPIDVNERVHGGVSALETYALNPLWAFFRYRLNVHYMPAYAQWPSLQDRGNLLHHVMRQLWSGWSTQQLMIDEIQKPDWERRLHDLVCNEASHMLWQWPSALRELEIERSISVVDQWLGLEVDRPEFMVLACEQESRFVEGQLDLRVVIDRVDRLADGSFLLIDYKSGSSLPNPKRDWMGARLRSLQLLAYCSVLRQQQQEPCGLAWAQLNLANLRWVGVAREDLQLQGVASIDSLDAGSHVSWSEQLAVWDHQVRSIAKAFAQGRIENRFWQRDDMKHCDLGALLRTHEVEQDD